MLSIIKINIFLICISCASSFHNTKNTFSNKNDNLSHDEKEQKLISCTISNKEVSRLLYFPPVLETVKHDTLQKNFNKKINILDFIISVFEKTVPRCIICKKLSKQNDSIVKWKESKKHKFHHNFFLHVGCFKKWCANYGVTSSKYEVFLDDNLLNKINVPCPVCNIDSNDWFKVKKGYIFYI